jgi:nucleoid DNA-binding protein
MALGLQERGYTFREARKLVRQFWAVVRDLLLAGKKVDMPIGSLSVRPAPPVQSRERFSRKQVLFRRRRRIVFRPKEL